MTDQNDLRKIIEKFHSTLLIPLGINSEKLLIALATVESSFGQNNVPRYEPAYGPGGRYFAADHVKRAYKNWGAWDASKE